MAEVDNATAEEASSGAPPSPTTGGPLDRDHRAEPVWYSPAWITAMVALVSAFLTIPDVVGEYLTKKQEIEVARQRVLASELANVSAKQSQEFEVVQSSLSQQGDERIFMLRYFAATLDDPEAKEWAEAEVTRLDELVMLQGQLDRQRLAIAAREEEIAQMQATDSRARTLTEEVSNIKAELDRKNLEVSELRQRAGITSNPIIFEDKIPWRIIIDWPREEDSETARVVAEGGQWSAECRRSAGPECIGSMPWPHPLTLDVMGLQHRVSFEAHLLGRRDGEPSRIQVPLDYSCHGLDGVVRCKLVKEPLTGIRR